MREIGVKLYLLWLQDLQENVDELGLLVYGSIIPGFPNPLSKVNASKIYRPQKFIESVYSCISGTGYTTVTSSQYLSYLEIDSGIYAALKMANCVCILSKSAWFENVLQGVLC